MKFAFELAAVDDPATELSGVGELFKRRPYASPAKTDPAIKAPELSLPNARILRGLLKRLVF